MGASSGLLWSSPAGRLPALAKLNPEHDLKHLRTHAVTEQGLLGRGWAPLGCGPSIRTARPGCPSVGFSGEMHERSSSFPGGFVNVDSWMDGVPSTSWVSVGLSVH